MSVNHSPIRQGIIGPLHGIPIHSPWISGAAAEIVVPVANPDDDGEWNGVLDPISVDINIGNSAGTGRKCYFLFENTGIPQGAKIDEAYLILTSAANSSNVTVKVIIDAADEDNPARPANAADADGRPRTANQIEWDNITAWVANTEYQTPDITVVIQELVTRPGFAENSILIFLEDNGSTINAGRKTRSYNHNPASAAELVVRYSEVGEAPFYLLKQDNFGLLLETSDYLLKEDAV